MQIIFGLTSYIYDLLQLSHYGHEVTGRTTGEFVFASL